MEALGLSLEIVLDSISDGTIVVDDRARLLHANRPARELLSDVRNGAVGSGRLAFAHPSTQASFERALARCHSRAEDLSHAQRASEFLVLDAEGTVIARAALRPLQRNRFQHGGGAAASLLCLHGQPHGTRVRTDSLRGLYGLTEAEARVAAQVVTAGSLREVASRLEISANTVKSHLKRIFLKCEVASLAQLSALVATAPRMP
jgi:DNA-binding CsgD family transcriptional regulator